jgi:hypothetical protein
MEAEEEINPILRLSLEGKRGRNLKKNPTWRGY